tara:strand:+ start:95 stop:391 length:297 start_codon:yes stop_codon:yes gene_type:complete
MLYLFEQNGKYNLPDDVWNIIKEYAGVYHINNVSLVNTISTGDIYSLYRSWFGRFILPDEYDYWNNDIKKKWLFKNLVTPKYLLDKDKYMDMIDLFND